MHRIKEVTGEVRMEDGGYKAYEIRRLDANKLLERTIWTRNRTIIFRGVDDSEYKLLPSAYRDKGKNELQRIYKAYFERNSIFRFDSDASQENAERISLMWFYDLANQQGINVPEIPHLHLGEPMMEFCSLPKIEKSKWMSNEWFEIAALAQHYGIPTRLLDWTFDMNAAIYFAIRNIDEDTVTKTPDKCFSVWELNKSLVSLIAPDVRFIVPRYFDNPNIRAQSGILSVFDGKIKDTEFSLEETVEKQYENSNEGLMKVITNSETPVLTRLDIPYSEIPVIKRNLESRGLRYDCYFPGLSGVANSIRDMAGI